MRFFVLLSLSNNKFRINGDILDHLEKEKPVDHLMSSEQYETHHVPFLEEDCTYARPLCTEEMLQHLGNLSFW